MMIWCRASCPRMSVDILGTNWSVPKHGSLLLYGLRTVRLIRTESPGRPPRLSHSSWTLEPNPLIRLLRDLFRPTICQGSRDLSFSLGPFEVLLLPWLLFHTVHIYDARRYLFVRVKTLPLLSSASLVPAIGEGQQLLLLRRVNSPKIIILLYRPSRE